MASLHLSNINKPVETIHPSNLPDASPDHIANGLKAVVDHSSEHSDLGQGIHAHVGVIERVPWIHNLIPGIEKLGTKYHVGNFVMIRGTNEKIFESMPIYARIGMHLLFYGKEQTKVLQSQRIEHLLEEQSVKEGKIFNSPESVKNIPSFVKTYNLQLDELLYPDLKEYKSFNEFFYRKLKADARPVQNAEDINGFCSAADCRLTVYPTVDLAKQFWVKGEHFNIPNLLNIPADSETALSLQNGAVAIFRLAPADYHRFHSPLDATVGDVTHIKGQYYTVNPQAVNEPGFDVFTANTRSVCYLTHTVTGKQVAFVAIGALLVGSIQWTNGGQKGNTVKRGEELGYFAYGGSTIVVVFPPGTIEFDQDLVKNSENVIETLMKVGYSLGHVPAAAA